MKESSLWKWLDKPLPKLHLTRVEDLVNVGRSDVEGCLDGSAFIIELKVADRPARSRTPIRTQSEITTEQCDWLEARRAAGGLAWLLIQVGQGHEAKRYLLDGRVARKARAGLTEDRLEDLSVCWSKADSEGILRAAAGFLL